MLKLIFLLIVVTIFSACDEKAPLLFSDDFEIYADGAIPSSPWQKSGEGKVFIDSAKSFSGKKSVHFISGETYRNRAFLGIFDQGIFPLKDNKYYGKMSMFVDKAPPDGVHWTMLQSSGKVTKGDFRAEVRYGGQHRQKLMANYDTTGVKSDCWKHSSVKIPEQRWFAVEWFFDGKNSLMKIWINGVMIDDLTLKERGQGCLADDLGGKWIFPVFENVQIGWVDYQPKGGERNIWIDDFQISSKPFNTKMRERKRFH